MLIASFNAPNEQWIAELMRITFTQWFLDLVTTLCGLKDSVLLDYQNDAWIRDISDREEVGQTQAGNQKG